MRVGNVGKGQVMALWLAGATCWHWQWAYGSMRRTHIDLPPQVLDEVRRKSGGMSSTLSAQPLGVEVRTAFVREAAHEG
jgi:hypothetical protein